MWLKYREKEMQCLRPRLGKVVTAIKNINGVTQKDKVEISKIKESFCKIYTHQKEPIQK